MTHKSGRIAAFAANFEGSKYDARYVGFFHLFNEEEFYQSHDVLEDLWLEVRGTPDDTFYKALIQLAGAFVHLKKSRLRPARSLFRLSKSYLQTFPDLHHGLDLSQTVAEISKWESLLQELAENPLDHRRPPKLFPADIAQAS